MPRRQHAAVEHLVRARWRHERHEPLGELLGRQLERRRAVGPGALQRDANPVYLSRPPIPQDRLERRADGKYVLSLKRTWKGGVKAIVFEPLDLIARLAALVPAPYLALRRFHGVFAPHHTLRALIVPTPSADSPVPIAPKRPGRMSWGDLLMRVWTIDALKCPHCGGRMRVIAAIHDPDAITAILAAVHSERWVIPATGPPIDSPLAALAAA